MIRILMKAIQGILRFLPIIIMGVIPLFFLPISADYYDVNKWSLLVFAALIIFVAKGLETALHNRFSLHWSPLATALTVLAVASLLSTIIISTNKGEALSYPLGVPLFAALLLFVIATEKDHKEKTLLAWFLSAGAGVAALLALYGALGLGKTLSSVPFLANPLWTPLGSSIALISILLISLPVTVGILFRHLKKKEEGEPACAVVVAVVTSLGLVVTRWQMAKVPVQLLPHGAGWTIFLETIKNPLHLFFGVGPENFLSAFTAGRPVSLNTTDLWSVRFTAGSSFMLHVATTMGLAGILGLIFLVRSMILPILSPGRLLTHLDTRIALLLALLVLLLLPPSLPVLVTIVAVILLSNHNQRTIVIHSAKNNEWLRLVHAGGHILLALVGLFFLTRFYLAHIAFGNAVSSLDKNDGTATYTALIKAVSINPYPSVFHATLSQTSLSLAAAILNRASDAKQPLNDKDKQLVTDFYQQAIREAKFAVQRAPTSVLSWENLANIYRSFLGVAANSDQWTIAALSQAIQLDPTNPLLRVQLGNVYLRTNRTDQAVATFQSAVVLKDDLANAHYNLAFAYRQKKQYVQAAIEFRRTSRLVRPGSTDADRVNADVAETMSNLSTEEITSLSQTPAQSPTVSTEEILSPVVEFAPIPTPTLSLPFDAP